MCTSVTARAWLLIFSAVFGLLAIPAGRASEETVAPLNADPTGFDGAAAPAATPAENSDAEVVDVQPLKKAKDKTKLTSAAGEGGTNIGICRSINQPPPAAGEGESPKVDTGLDEEVLKSARSERESIRKVEKVAAAKKVDGPRILTPLPLTQSAPPDTRLQLPLKVTEPGYASVLSGTLQCDTELNAETLPHLIRGTLLIPPKLTLKINAGATIQLRASATPAKPASPGSPDPSKSAVIWVYGSLLVTGETGKPVEFSNQDKDGANLLFYGSEKSDIRGARLNGLDVAQNGGACLWTNTEFSDAKFYLLAAGAGLFTHCSFKRCGGIFAAYEEGPFALMVRRCSFETCRDGILFSRDPGPDCLLVDKNNFIGTRGANLRAMPRSGPANPKAEDELLIGENWYGTNIEEEIDRRIVDRRTDPAIHAHLNTRPPASKIFATAGAAASSSQLINTLQEQQGAMVKMLQALQNRQKSFADRRVAMDKSARKQP